MAKKNKNRGRKAFTQLPAPSAPSNTTEESVRETVRNAWATKGFMPTPPSAPTSSNPCTSPDFAVVSAASPPPTIKTSSGEMKNLDSEFPALPGSDSKTMAGKEDRVTPVDLDEGGWGQGDVSGPVTPWDSSWPAASTPGATIPTATNPHAKHEWDDLTVPETTQQLLKKRVDEACKGWPWDGVPDKLVTLAPYHMNLHPEAGAGPLALPMVEQKSNIFVMMLNIDDLGRELLKYIFPHHDAAWKLAATCQQAWDIICKKVDIWDMTAGYFNNCDKMVTAEDVKPFRAGSVSAHLVISPLRRPEGMASYVEQVQNLCRLKMAVLNFGSSLRNVQFHRVPFISINNLKLLIPQMTNLRTLGIYNCQLVHLANGQQLIDILTIDRLKGKEYSIALDWYPCFHLGPNVNRVGTYGVIWDNVDRDLRVPIWSLARRIVIKARKHGIDFESPHTMFRQWLEKSGCWAVGKTLNSFFHPDASGLEIAAMVVFCWTLGSVQAFKGKYRYFTCTERLAYWGREFLCGACKEQQPAIFFPGLMAVRFTDAKKKNGILPECGGCFLTTHLRHTTDHYKNKKRAIIKAWLMDDNNRGHWNTTDLRKAIEDYELLGIEEMAAALDEHRKNDVYDRETQERQRPITDAERGGSRGAWRRSTDVKDSKMEEEAYLTYPLDEFRNYHQSDECRFDGHGIRW